MDTPIITLIIASASLIVSFIALCMSYIRDTKTYKHNKILVKPNLSFSMYANEGVFTVKLENKGLGPATLDNVKWVLKGRPVSNEDFFQNLSLTTKPNALSESQKSQYDNLISGMVIAKGETKYVFVSQQMEDGKEDEFREYFIDNHKIYLDYTNDYGDKFKTQLPLGH